MTCRKYLWTQSEEYSCTCHHFVKICHAIFLNGVIDYFLEAGNKDIHFPNTDEN